MMMMMMRRRRWQLLVLRAQHASSQHNCGTDRRLAALK
jgi:hypothetical protein